MKSNVKVVVAKKTSDYWGTTEGQEMLVTRSYFYNGESWYNLQDQTTKVRIKSPSILWDEKNNNDKYPGSQN